MRSGLHAWGMLLGVPAFVTIAQKGGLPPRGRGGKRGLPLTFPAAPVRVHYGHRSLEDEASELEGKVPPATERQRKVQRWIEERVSALGMQQQLVDAKQMELIAVEARLRMAEKELDFLADERQASAFGGRHARWKTVRHEGAA